MYARTAGIWASSASTALTCTTRRPAASVARSAGGSEVPSRSAAWSGVRSRTRPRRRSISGAGSICLGAVGVDRVDGGLQRVEALEQHVDRLAAEAVGALAQQLEDVLHLVRQRGHAGEAHRRAHALHRVRDPEDLVDRLLVVGLLLDPHDGEVELLEVLATLREEHREVLGGLHQRFR